MSYHPEQPGILIGRHHPPITYCIIITQHIFMNLVTFISCHVLLSKSSISYPEQRTFSEQPQTNKSSRDYHHQLLSPPHIASLSPNIFSSVTYPEQPQAEQSGRSL